MKCNCDPEKVNIGEWERTVCVLIPSFIELRYNNPDHKIRKTVGIDICLLDEIWELWRLGIVTTGNCCGHNKKGAPAYIGVVDEDIKRMKILGYEVQPNPNDLKREDSFIPKSLNSHSDFIEKLKYIVENSDNYKDFESDIIALINKK